MPLRRGALSVCPCGDPWGTPLQVEINYFMGPCNAPKGTNPKVTSAKGHFCAYPKLGSGRSVCGHGGKAAAFAPGRTQPGCLRRPRNQQVTANLRTF